MSQEMIDRQCTSLGVTASQSRLDSASCVPLPPNLSFAITSINLIGRLAGAASAAFALSAMMESFVGGTNCLTSCADVGSSV